MCFCEQNLVYWNQFLLRETNWWEHVLWPFRIIKFINNCKLQTNTIRQLENGCKCLATWTRHWLRQVSSKRTLFWTRKCKEKTWLWFSIFEHSFVTYTSFQFGNTCYSNSVLQALYFCKPFREKVLEYKAKNKRTKETLLSCLADLFFSIATQKKKVGSIAPKKFIARLRKEKEEFDNYVQQDAHEFLNFLINHINEIILAERNQGQKKSATTNEPPEPTWVHEIFQGILTSETRCLNCETVSSKDENFFDLQVDVDQNTSITHCLRCFSNTETLCSDNKFKCDNCCRYVQ